MGVGHDFFQPNVGVGHQNFLPLRGVGHVFLRNRVFIPSGPHPPLYFLTSPLLYYFRSITHKDQSDSGWFGRQNGTLYLLGTQYKHDEARRKHIWFFKF